MKRALNILMCHESLQDTTIKLWDRRGRAFNCQATFHPRSESVRDVQFNPHQAHLFAAVCENGSVHVWDRRKPAGPLVKVRGLGE